MDSALLAAWFGGTRAAGDAEVAGAAAHAQHAILCLADAIQLAAALIIGLAAFQATARALVTFFRRSTPEPAIDGLRLRLGRWLVVALEFQVAADILRTAVAPTWNEIGQLAAVIGLRTVLNYFLQKEIERAGKSGNSAPA